MDNESNPKGETMTSPMDAANDFVRPKPYYEVWQANEGIPVYKEFFVADLEKVKLGYWRRFGCHGAFVNLTDSHLTTAAILEVPPGRKTIPIKHMFETFVYGISGRGRTTMSVPDVAPVSLDWRAFSLFAPPLNTTYSHENLDSLQPLRLLMVSNAPLVLSLFHNECFVFENPAIFDDRFRGQQDFFSARGRHLGGRVWRANFIEDVSKFALINWAKRGAGAKSFHISMADQTTACHVSEFAIGTYKKAHRHGPGAHVVILAGQGYSLLWEEGKERVRIDWKPGSMFAPPDMWYHQHFNTGAEPARYLALRRGGSPEHPLRLARGSRDEEGAEQIEYEDEDPEIRRMYEAELQLKGVAIRMPPRTSKR